MRKVTVPMELVHLSQVLPSCSFHNLNQCNELEVRAVSVCCPGSSAKIAHCAEGNFNFIVWDKIAERWLYCPRVVLGVP